MDGHWFQDQLRRSGRSQADLARYLRLNAAAVSRMFKGERQMKLLEAAQIAAFLGVSHEEVIRRAGLYDQRGEFLGLAHEAVRAGGLHETPGATSLLAPPASLLAPPEGPPAGARLSPFGQRDLPVRGRAQGGPDGSVMLDNEPIDWTYRPPELLGTRDAFAMFVTGSSMGDVLPEGATVYIHPSLPPRPNDLVVVEKRSHEALIKRLLRRTADQVVLRQYNPPLDFDLPREEIRALYRVIGALFP